ncbi:hypothetical protein SK128_026136, partial [Halocaridina rubra]
AAPSLPPRGYFTRIWQRRLSVFSLSPTLVGGSDCRQKNFWDLLVEEKKNSARSPLVGGER